MILSLWRVGCVQYHMIVANLAYILLFIAIIIGVWNLIRYMSYINDLSPTVDALEINIRAISRADQRIYASELIIENPLELRLFIRDSHLNIEYLKTIKLKEPVHTIEICEFHMLKLDPTPYTIHYRNIGLEKISESIVNICRRSSNFILFEDHVQNISFKFSTNKPNTLEITSRSEGFVLFSFVMGSRPLTINWSKSDILFICKDIVIYKLSFVGSFLLPYFLIFFQVISKMSDSCNIVYDNSFTCQSSVELSRKSILSRYHHYKHDEEFKTIFHDMLTQSIQYGKGCTPGSLDRYYDIVPYSGKRIVLDKVQSGSDYINASPIEIEFQSPADTLYAISTQGPLASTIIDFWTMVRDQSIDLIVMLTDLEEKTGREKCHLYWPTSKNPNICLNSDISIEFVREEQLDDGIIYRRFKWNRFDKIEYVNQYQLTHWIDHGSVQLPRLISLLSIIAFQSRMIVHCSAGVGRSGTFIVAFILYHFFKTKRLPIPLDYIQGDDMILFLIEKLREQRAGMIQTFSQFKLLYQLVDKLCS